MCSYFGYILGLYEHFSIAQQFVAVVTVVAVESWRYLTNIVFLNDNKGFVTTNYIYFKTIYKIDGISENHNKWQTFLFLFWAYLGSLSIKRLEQNSLKSENILQLTQICTKLSRIRYISHLEKVSNGKTLFGE